VSVPGLTHLEATAIQVTLVGKPVLILGSYISPSRQLMEADLTACFGGDLPVLMAGDLNTKHVVWNSRLNTNGGNTYVIMPTGTPVSSLDRTPNHQPIQPLGYSRRSEQHDNQESLIPSVSDFVLRT